MKKHVDDVCSVLGTSVPRETVERELDTFVNKYRVSIPSAKRSIVKKYGGDPDKLTVGVEKAIAEIAAGEGSIDVKGRVLQAKRRDVLVSGEKKLLLSGILEDATGSIPFTIWDYEGEEDVTGRLLTVRNAYTTSYKDRPQLNLSSRTRYWFVQDGEWKREPRKLADIRAGEQNVFFTAKIISVNQKEIDTQEGRKTIYYGLIGDETRTVRFTAWKDFGLQKGEVVNVNGAYVRERMGELQVNMSEQTSVERTDAQIPSVARFGSPKICTIAELRDGMGNVSLTARVVSVEEREMQSNGQTKHMVSGILADESGRVAFTGWRDFPFAQGETVTITGAYVRSWKGVPQLKFDDKSEISRAERMIGEMTTQPAEWKLEELEERGGAMEVAVAGLVVDVREGSGVVLRCPECRRPLKGMECATHGSVSGVQDVRIRMVVDDGTGSLTVTLNREISEQLTGLKLEDMSANPDAFGEICRRLLLKRVRLTGNTYSDDFGLGMFASAASFHTPDALEAARQLFEETVLSLGM